MAGNDGVTIGCGVSNIQETSSISQRSNFSEHDKNFMYAFVRCYYLLSTEEVDITILLVGATFYMYWMLPENI